MILQAENVFQLQFLHDANFDSYPTRPPKKHWPNLFQNAACLRELAAVVRVRQALSGLFRLAVGHASGRSVPLDAWNRFSLVSIAPGHSETHTLSGVYIRIARENLETYSEE